MNENKLFKTKQNNLEMLLKQSKTGLKKKMEDCIRFTLSAGPAGNSLLTGVGTKCYLTWSGY